MLKEEVELVSARAKRLGLPKHYHIDCLSLWNIREGNLQAAEGCTSGVMGAGNQFSFYKISKFSSARVLLGYHTSNTALFMHEDRHAR
ncbi:hypothetical protein WG66_001739 [Moniliophthora roreri]|nr:hypothetical protein WG66_001739 [Moniliophthora roreri]